MLLWLYSAGRFLYDLLYLAFGSRKVQTSGPGVCRFLPTKRHEFWRKLIIAVFAVLPDNPAVGLVKVLGQLRPVVVEFTC